MARKAAALSIIVIIIIIIIIIIIKIIENIVRMVQSLKELSTEDSEVEDLFCGASFQLSLLATSDGRVLVSGGHLRFAHAVVYLLLKDWANL